MKILQVPNREKYSGFMAENFPELYGPWSIVQAFARPNGAVEVHWPDAAGPAPAIEQIMALKPEPAELVQLQGQLDALEEQRAKKIKRLRAVVAAALISNGWTQDDTMMAGRAFFGDHGPAIRAYVDGAAPKFSEDVVSDDRAWLGLFASPGVTIREVILAHVA